MTEPINVELKVFKQVGLWFLPYQPTDPEVLNTDYNDNKLNAALRHSFDYEKPGKDIWILHIDIEINVIPFAKIKVRTSFQVSCTREILFRPDILDSINKIAIQGAEKGFFELCKIHNIATNFPKILNQEEYLENIREGVINQYNYRIKNKPNIPKNNEGAIHLTTGKKTLLLTQGTFIILDNVLHVNKLFDLTNNQKVFHDIIPEPIYYTIKLICMELTEKKISLKFLHAVLFQICLDCALQLLLDRHAQTLQPAIIKAGLTTEVQKNFIEFGSSTLRQFRKDYKTCGAKIKDLEIKYDWNSLIK